MNRANRPHRERDLTQALLDAVTERLSRPEFLRTLSPSRLPSQAVSEDTVSSPELSALLDGERSELAQEQAEQPKDLGKEQGEEHVADKKVQDAAEEKGLEQLEELIDQQLGDLTREAEQTGPKSDVPRSA